MPIRNPTAHPGVILASKQHLDSFGRYIDLAGNLVEAEKKRRAEKAAGLAEAMQTPEVDYEGILPQWQQNLMNDVGAYEKFAVDLASQGVDLTNPLSEGRLALSQMETKLKRDAAMFRQNTTIAQQTAKALAEDPDGDLYDKTASMANYGLFLQNPGVIDQLGGQLLVPRTKSISEYETNAFKDLPRSDLEITKADQTLAGYDVNKTTQGLTPDQYLAGTSDLIDTKPGYKKQQQELFSALSPDMQEIYKQRATDRYGDKITDDAILTEFAADGAKKRWDIQQLTANKKTSSSTGSPGPKGGDDAFSGLYYQVAGLQTGDPSYAINYSLTDDSSQAKVFRETFGKIPGINLDAGVQEVDLGGHTTGRTFEVPYQEIQNGPWKWKKVPEVIESAYAITVNGQKQYYVSTNKTKHFGKADKRNGGGYLRAPGNFDYGYPVTLMELYSTIAENTGEFSSTKDIQIAKDKGLLTEGGALIFGKQPAASETDYESKVFGGK